METHSNNNTILHIDDDAFTFDVRKKVPHQ